MASLIRPITDRLGITTPTPIYRSPWKPVDVLYEGNVVQGIFDADVPDDKLLVVDGPTGRQTTRKQLVSRTQQIAHSLRKAVGRREGDAVCVFSPNSDTFQVIVLGIICAGLIATPANYAYTPSELEHQLRETGAVTLFVHPWVLDTAVKAARLVGWTDQEIKDRIILAVYGSDVEKEKEVKGLGFKNLDDLLTGEEMTPFVVRDPKERVAVMSFSSGTTGKAKAVQNTHFNMSSVLAIMYPLPVGDNAVHLAVLPFSHIYAFAINVLWPLQRGDTIVVVPRFEPENYLQLLQKYKCTALWIVPPIALLLARDPRTSKYDLSSVTYLMCGAAPLGPELQQELSAKLPNANATQGYGLSEMSPTSHFCDPNSGKLGSIGWLLPNVEARLVDPDTGKDVVGRGPGKTGELWLKGPTRMKGYLKRPKETAETIVEDGWLRTGDVAYIDDEDYFFIADRLKELIKYKGYPVPPAELEALLITHPKVKDVAVVGVWTDEQATELPRAYVVRGDIQEDDKTLEKEIQDWVQSKVAQHKRLRGGVKFVKEIPKSPSGKILRRILRDQAKAESTIKPKL